MEFCAIKIIGIPVGKNWEKLVLVSSLVDNARNKSLNLRLRQEELDLIQECSEKLNLTRTDTIIESIKRLKVDLENKK